MPKPSGLSFDITTSGPRFRVTESSRATDAIWDAVEAAIEACMSPEEVKSEMVEAWSHCIKEQEKHARKVLQ